MKTKYSAHLVETILLFVDEASYYRNVRMTGENLADLRMLAALRVSFCSETAWMPIQCEKGREVDQTYLVTDC